MLAEKVRQYPAKVLTEAQREQYFRDGFLILPDYVPPAWVGRLQAALAELMERSRAVTRTDEVYILEEGHSPATPRLHRITSPQDRHPTFWELCTDPVITDLVTDVVGPNVKFHHAKLNVKSEMGTQGFKWHQDIQGWPHTDFSLVTLGIYINGCDADQGPIAFMRGTHEGPLFSMYDDAGKFVVRVSDRDLESLKDKDIVPAIGGPGTIVLLNCRTVHSSVENRSTKARPLLLPVFSSADSFPYTTNAIPSPHQGDIVRGQRALFASFDTTPCEVPPDFRAGYRPPWMMQKEQEAHAAE